jgi:hypothetical protein
LGCRAEPLDGQPVQPSRPWKQRRLRPIPEGWQRAARAVRQMPIAESLKIL